MVVLACDMRIRGRGGGGGAGMAIVGPHHKVMTVWALEFRCP